MLISRITSKLRILLHFFAAQGVTMAANLFYGLLCIRLLPSTEYAKFAVLFAVQGTLISLMDVNFTGTLAPLVGERLHDRKLIADYLASLRRLSYWAYGIVGVALIFFYPRLVRNRDWNWHVVGAMVLILLISTWFMRLGSAYGAVLIMLRERTEWYKGQLGSSLGTLVVLLCIWRAHRLGPFTAIVINVGGIVFAAVYYFFKARVLLGTPGVVSASKRRAIVRLALPNVPQAIFFALQGQLAMFLITYLGHTKAVASAGALARLSQLFAIILQMNPLLLEPYFASLPQKLLKSRYAVALVLTALTSASIALVASMYPQIFLWVLGPQYRGLQEEVKIAIGAGAVSCLSGIMWGINSARRFVFWWNVTFSIVLTVAVQALCIFKLDMSTVRSVLLLTLATNLASLFVNILSGAYGFMKGPREVEDKPLSAAALEVEASIEMFAIEHGEPAEATLPQYSTGGVPE